MATVAPPPKMPALTTTIQPVSNVTKPLATTSPVNNLPTNTPAVIKTQPSGPAMLPPMTSGSQLSPQKMPVGDIRPVSYTTPPLPTYRGPTTIEEPPFSTASPSTSSPRPTYPLPTSSNTTPQTPTQTQPQSQPQGQLGFVLFSDDQPTRR